MKKPVNLLIDGLFWLLPHAVLLSKWGPRGAEGKSDDPEIIDNFKTAKSIFLFREYFPKSEFNVKNFAF